MNIQSVRILKDKRATYTDKVINNNPIFLIFIGVQSQSKYYERKIYSMLEMTGDIGGFVEIVEQGGLLVVFLFASNSIRIKLLRIFQTILLTDDGLEPDFE